MSSSRTCQHCAMLVTSQLITKPLVYENNVIPLDWYFEERKLLWKTRGYCDGESYCGGELGSHYGRESYCGGVGREGVIVSL